MYLPLSMNKLSRVRRLRYKYLLLLLSFIYVLKFRADFLGIPFALRLFDALFIKVSI